MLLYCQQTNDDGIASVVENEYQTWFDRAVEQDVPCPSLAVEIVSKTHMLRELLSQNNNTILHIEYACVTIGKYWQISLIFYGLL